MHCEKGVLFYIIFIIYSLVEFFLGKSKKISANSLIELIIIVLVGILLFIRRKKDVVDHDIK